MYGAGGCLYGTSPAWLPGGLATWAGGCFAGGSFLSTCFACSFGLFGCTGTGVCLSTGCCWLGGALAGGALHWPALLPTELKVLCFGGERPLFLSSPVAEGPDREEDGGGARLVSTELSSGTKPGGAPPDCAPALRCCWFGGGPCRGGRRGLFPLPAARKRRRSVPVHATFALAGAFPPAMARFPGLCRSRHSMPIRSVPFRRRKSASARAALMPWRRKASAQLTAKLHCTLEQKG